MIQIIFEFESEYGTFRDAITLPEDHSYTNEEIDAMKQQRFDNWINAINSASTGNVMNG